jgi:hypothetical protein
MDISGGMLQGTLSAGGAIQKGMMKLADDISREQEEIRKRQDELDAFRGQAQFLQQQGMITAEDLAPVADMPLAKAKGFMTSLIADATRKQEMMTKERLMGMRVGRGGGGGFGREGLIWDNRTGSYGRINPETGEFEPLTISGQGSGQGVTAERFALGSSLPVEAGGSLVVTGYNKDGSPKLQYVKEDAAAQLQRGMMAQQAAELAGEAERLRGKIAKGGDKFGPDWSINPLPSRTEKLRSVEAKLNVLRPENQPVPKGRTQQEMEAIRWAEQNPNDPRAVEIKKRLGIQ